MLESEKCIRRDNRRAAHRSGNDSVRYVEIEQCDLAQRNVSTERAKSQFLANVVRSVAQNSTPHGLDPAACILECKSYTSSTEPLGET